MTVMELWGQSSEKVAESRLTLSVDKLRTNAERVIVGYQEQVIKATDDLQKAKRDAVKNPDFGVIVTASMELAAAKRYLQEALSLFEELFGEKSRYEK